MKRLLLLLPLLLLSSCGGTSIRQLDCTLITLDSEGFGRTVSFVINTKTGDIIEFDRMTDLARRIEGGRVIDEETKIVNDTFYWHDRISIEGEIAYMNFAINLKTLKGKMSYKDFDAGESGRADISCVWAEPPSTVIDQRR